MKTLLVLSLDSSFNCFKGVKDSHFSNPASFSRLTFHKELPKVYLSWHGLEKTSSKSQNKTARLVRTFAVNHKGKFSILGHWFA